MRRFSAGDQIDRYQIVRALGAGGMAEVYLATAPGGASVVLKVPLDDHEDVLVRFRDEARVGIRVDHPNLVETLDLIEHDGVPILVLRYIDGVSLEELAAKSPLSTQETALVGQAMASALAALHDARDEAGRELNVVHRDVSAPNVLVDREGTARLIDLGIARSSEALHKTQTGVLLGTLPNMAPELFCDEAPTPQSDLWSLACVLYQASRGRRLFEGKSAAGLIGVILGFSPDGGHPTGWATLDPALKQPLSLALRPERADRVSDASALAVALSDAVGDATRAKRALGQRVARSLDGDAMATADTLSFYLPEQLHTQVTRSVETGEWIGAFETIVDGDEGLVDESGQGATVENVPAPARPAPSSWPPRAASDAAFRSPAHADGGEELELARPSRAPLATPQVAQPPGPRRPAPRPPGPKSSGGGGKLLAIAGGLGVVTLLLWMGVQKLADARDSGPTQAEIVEEESALLAAPADLPDCFTGKVGEMYMYKGAGGRRVVERSIRAVPRDKRRSARCVTQGR